MNKTKRNNYDISPFFTGLDIYGEEGHFMSESEKDNKQGFLNKLGVGSESASPKIERSGLENGDLTDEKDVFDKIMRPGVTLGDIFAAIFWFGSIAEDEGMTNAEREYLDLAVYELSKFYFKDFYKTKHLPKVVEAVENIRKTLIEEKEAEEN